jgi:hypothetical protein
MAVTNKGETHRHLLELMGATRRMLSEKEIREMLGVAKATSWTVINRAHENREIYICRWRVTDNGTLERLYRAGSRKDAERPPVMTDAERQERTRNRRKVAKLEAEAAARRKLNWKARRAEGRRIAREMREAQKVEAVELAMLEADRAVKKASESARNETVARLRSLVAQQPANPFASLMVQVA